LLNISNNEIELNTTLEPRESAIDNYNIILKEVSPYPKPDQAYNPDDYSIKIVVTKK
jgi:hypothetical protein